MHTIIDVEKFETACWHEAGHVWAGLRFEGRVPDWATAVADPPHSAGVTATRWFEEKDLDTAQREGILTRVWIARRAMTYFAGTIAELLAKGRWPLQTAAEYREALNTPDAAEAHRLLLRFASPAEVHGWAADLIIETGLYLRGTTAAAAVARVAGALRAAGLEGRPVEEAELAELLEGVELLPVPEGEAGRCGFDLAAAVDALTALEGQAVQVEAA